MQINLNGHWKYHATGLFIKVKIAVLLSALILYSSQASAGKWNDANCTNRGGIVVEVGADNYCLSKKSMNWWSASVWCERHGGHLSSVKKLCGIDNPIQAGQCPNMQGKGSQKCFWLVDRGRTDGTIWDLCYARADNYTPDFIQAPISTGSTGYGFSYAFCE